MRKCNFSSTLQFTFPILPQKQTSVMIMMHVTTVRIELHVLRCIDLSNFLSKLSSFYLHERNRGRSWTNVDPIQS